jgi:hypothetical protein
MTRGCWRMETNAEHSTGLGLGLGLDYSWTGTGPRGATVVGLVSTHPCSANLSARLCYSLLRISNDSWRLFTLLYYTSLQFNSLRRRVFTLPPTKTTTTTSWRWWLFSLTALDFSCLGHLIATGETLKPCPVPTHRTPEHSIASRATQNLGTRKGSSESGTTDLSTSNKSPGQPQPH